MFLLLHIYEFVQLCGCFKSCFQHSREYSYDFLNLAVARIWGDFCDKVERTIVNDHNTNFHLQVQITLIIV